MKDRVQVCVSWAVFAALQLCSALFPFVCVCFFPTPDLALVTLTLAQGLALGC